MKRLVFFSKMKEISYQNLLDIEDITEKQHDLFLDVYLNFQNTKYLYSLKNSLFHHELLKYAKVLNFLNYK